MSCVFSEGCIAKYSALQTEDRGGNSNDFVHNTDTFVECEFVSRMEQMKVFLGGRYGVQNIIESKAFSLVVV